MAFVVKSGITAGIAATSYLSVQPAAGESWVITAFGTSEAGGDLVHIELYDGANAAILTIQPKTAASSMIKALVTNTIYFRLYNADAGAQKLGYCGVLL